MPQRSAEERRQALRNRTKKGVLEREMKGLGRKSVLDMSKAGNKKIINFEIKSGKQTNYIDILPFEITQPWYKELKSFSGSILGDYSDIGFTDYKLEIPVHRNVGENNDVFLCLKQAFGKKCPICEELEPEWAKDKENRDQSKIAALRPSWRCYYNVFDYDDPDAPVKLWADFSYHLFEKYLQEAMESESDDVIAFADLETGSSIEFKGRDKEFGQNKFIEAHSIKFKKREPYPESILKESFSLDTMLIIPTYDEVAKVHLGLDDIAKTPLETKPTRSRSRLTEKTEQAKVSLETPAKPNRSRTRVESVTDIDCPYNGKFGNDFNQLETCSDCKELIFQACKKKYEQIDKSSQEELKPNRSRRSKISDDDIPF